MKSQTNTTEKLLPFLMLSLLGLPSTASAEDTEAFFAVTPSAPNVMFVMDTSGGMNKDLKGTAPGENGYEDPSRMTIIQNGLKTVFKNAPANLNVGLMNFGPHLDEKQCGNNKLCFVDDDKRDYGIHGVAFPISPIDEKAYKILGLTALFDNLPWTGGSSVRKYIPKIAESWEARGPSPIVDALYEAALYFRGEKMYWGQDIPSTEIAAHPVTYQGSAITVERAEDGIIPESAPLYKSPIKNRCQSNYIVLLTDGVPTYYDATSSGQKGKVAGPAGSTFFGDASYGTLAGGVGKITSQSGDGGAQGGKGGINPKGFSAGEGGYELVRYIGSHDNAPTIEGDQFIDTFVVGFGPTLSSNEKQYLETLATYDDPATHKVEGYYSALNTEELVASFASILDIISKRAISYASPGYSVNVKSGLEHEREVYVPMFNRDNSALWPGNLKKFKINEVSGKRVIQDKNNINAVNELGNITDTAIDLWSTSLAADPDGKEVTRGGVANLLPLPDTRNILSNLGCTGGAGCLTALIESKAGDGGLIDNALLGLDTGSAVERKQLISFIRGKNDDGTPRYHMGDMMHSEPIVVTYNDGSNGSAKEQYIFVATNEGYLHAIDTNTGIEQFAFMPQELLKIIKPQFSGISATDHPYGLDGSITYWEDKVNNKKYLYFGMRRGGQSYYALDVTSVTSPELLWSKNAADAGYANLGQTWSTPYLARVGVNGKTCQSGRDNCREVLIVSGGYDPLEDRDVDDGSLILDDAKKAVTTTMGNDIFIMDALTGDKIWSLQSDTTITNRADLASSVPGGLRMLDTNYNKLVDRLYFADTGGYVWRLDLSEKIGDSENPSKLTKFADLGDIGTTDSRKFYNEPDVSSMKLNGKSVFVVSIGSGFRPHPLDETLNDNFYMLLDKSPYGIPDTSAILDGNLATINISGAVGATTVTQSGSISDSTQNYKGWKVILPENGEKSLSTSLTFDGVVTFTSLIPAALKSDPDDCDPPGTHGRFYAINILTGEAGMDLDEDGTITDADLAIDVVAGDIPGTPQSVFNPLDVTDKLGDDGTPTGDKACTHPVDIRIGKKLSQATGYDACRLESVYWSDPVSE